MIKDLEHQIVAITKEIVDEGEIELAEELGSNTRLFGREGILDSMGLVSLVVAIEQAVEDSYGVQISLADEKALSQTRSPYRTVATLAQYAEQEIREKGANGQ